MTTSTKPDYFSAILYGLLSAASASQLIQQWTIPAIITIVVTALVAMKAKLELPGTIATPSAPANSAAPAPSPSN